LSWLTLSQHYIAKGYYTTQLLDSATCTFGRTWMQEAIEHNAGRIGEKLSEYWWGSTAE